MRKAYLALALAALAVVAAIGLGTGPSVPSEPAGAVGRTLAALPNGSAAPPPPPNAAAAPSVLQPAVPLAADATAPPPLGSGEPPKLQADAAGRLVVDVHTRDESLALLRSLESTLR